MKYHSSKYWLTFLICLTSASFNTCLAASKSSLSVVSATHRQIDREYSVDGVVEAINQAQIAAQTSGQVLAVNFDVDDFVKKGQVLVRLKSLEQKASLNQVKARVAEAEAYLNAARKGYRRVKKLRAKRVASAADLDKALADVKAARARVNAARADVRQASQGIEYTTIKAPYSGIVLQRHIQPGEVASLGQPIMTGFSLDALRAVATVPQSQIGAIRRYRKAQIVLDSKPKQRRFKGRKLTIAPYADAQTHTFKVRVDFPKKVKGVYPGMFAKVAFVVGQERRLMIPAKTVVYRGEVRAVYVVDKKGRVFMRQVRLGRRYSDMIEILAGLGTGEKIAKNPVDAAIVLKTQRNKK
jgi:RND family efflux transporter MFP subunit